MIVLNLLDVSRSHNNKNRDTLPPFKVYWSSLSFGTRKRLFTQWQLTPFQLFYLWADLHQ